MIFVLRNRHQNVNLKQQNRLHPYYLIYIGKDGSVVVDHTEVKSLLDLLRLACKGSSEPIEEVCRRFNFGTQDGRAMQPTRIYSRRRFVP